jgi:hypothetical protein
VLPHRHSRASSIGTTTVERERMEEGKKAKARERVEKRVEGIGR